MTAHQQNISGFDPYFEVKVQQLSDSSYCKELLLQLPSDFKYWNEEKIWNSASAVLKDIKQSIRVYKQIIIYK